MNRKKLERHLSQFGCFLHHSGRGHDVWWDAGETRSTQLPRHKEINPFTARSICKDLNIPPPREK